MKSIGRKSMAWLLALVLLASSLQFGGRARAAGASVPDGTYSHIQYRYLQNNTNYDSAAHNFLYVENSGTLVIHNGKATFEHDIKSEDYALIPYIAFRKAGSAKAVINGSSVQGMEGYQLYASQPAASSAGNVKLSLDIENWSEKTDILMHVVIQNDSRYPGLNYDYWYNVQLWLDTSTLPSGGGDPGGGSGEQPVTLVQLNDLISVARTVYTNAIEGTENGQFPQGSKAELETHIQEAAAAAAQTEPAPTVINTAYASLTTALDQFKASVHTADRTALKEITAQVKSLLARLKEMGEAEGKAGYTYAPVTAGEFMKGVSTYLISSLNTANTVLTNDSATQAQVDSAAKTLTTRYNNYVNRYFVSSAPVPIYVLDTTEPTSTLSVHAGDFAGTAVLTMKFLKEYEERLFANLTFLNPEISEVVQSPPAAEGSLVTEGLDYAVEANRAILLQNGSNELQKVYQVVIRPTTGLENPNWLGFSYVRYKVDGETRAVYINYNVERLQALKQSAFAAQAFLDKAKPTGDAQSAFDAAKAQLTDAIQTANRTTANLAATRPQITAANATLQSAINAFRETAAYEVSFSAADREKEAFAPSSPYLLSPALLTTVSGVTYASFGIRESSAVQAFQVKNGTVFEDAELVRQDDAANTRMVRIRLNDLQALTEARIVVHDVPSTLRLNFNGVDNGALRQEIADANTLLATAGIGGKPGQYPAEAKAVLELAVGEAGKAATSLAGTQAQSDVAVTALKQAVASFKASVIKEDGLLDGKYIVNFTILTYGTSDTSVMQNYVISPALLEVSGSKKTVSFTLTQDKEITVLKFNGTDTTVVSRDAAKNTRLVSLEVDSLSGIVDGLVKVEWPTINYYHEYDVQLKLDASSVKPAAQESDTNALKLLASKAQLALDAAVEGGAAGQYPAGAKAKLATAIAHALQAAAIPASQVQIAAATAELDLALDVFQASETRSNGKYEVVLKADDSAVALYMETSGRLIVANGVNTLDLTPKAGFTLKRLVNQETGDVIEPSDTKSAAAAKAVTALAFTTTGTPVRFELSDLSAIYTVVLADENEAEHSFNLRLGSIILETDPVTPTPTPIPTPAPTNSGTVATPKPETGTDTPATGGNGSSDGSSEPAIRFSDVQGHWAQEAIQQAVGLGITSGYTDGTFHPNGVVTRAEFAVFLSRALKLEEGNQATVGLKDLVQVPAWARSQVVAATAAGLIQGYADQTFRPDQPITRAEIAVIIARAAKLTVDESASLSFADADGIPAWAKPGIAAAVNAGLIQGKAGNLFDANAQATRAEALTLIMRMLNAK